MPGLGGSHGRARALLVLCMQMPSPDDPEEIPPMCL